VIFVGPNLGPVRSEKWRFAVTGAKSCGMYWQA
jgi:hypothetical protein